MRINVPRRRALSAVSAAALAGTILCQSIAPAPSQAAPSVASAPADANTGTWAIDANRHYADKVQERRVSGYDEFYIATVGFRSTPGVRGSTSAWFHGGLYEIDSVGPGEYHSINDSMGRVQFTNVAQRGVLDLLVGQNPELIGTISVVFESDSTPFRLINGIMRDMAAAAQTELANLIEPLTLTALDADALSQQFSAAGDRIQSQATPSVGQKVRIALASLGDPDDLIDVKVNLFVAADPVLAPIVGPALSGAVPASVGLAGVLEPRTYSQRFSGDGARYDISFAVD
jgi:hypothetical protein